VAIVLGASKYINNTSLNFFYKYRIEKAIELFKSGKIEFFIVSGDNSRKEYNEPAQMKRDLIKAGVPKNIIYCDYAGFSTYDSILRMKTVFQQTKFVVISQKFQIERAIYIARRNGIKAYGCPSKDPHYSYYPSNKLREYLARVKAVLEVVLDKRPMFVGDKILIN
jgi:SanA protein